MKIPITIQMQPGENGAAVACMMLACYQKYVPLQEMREKCVVSRNGSSPEQVLRAAEAYGLEGEILHIDLSELKQQKLPIVIQWKKKYYAIVIAIHGDMVTVIDPAKGEYKLTMEKLGEIYKGTAIRFGKGEGFVPGGQRESLYSLLKERIWSVRSALTGLLIFSIICIVLDLRQTVLSRAFMDDIVGRNGYTPEKARTLLIMLYALVLLVMGFSLLRTRLIFSVSRRSSAVTGSRLFKKMFAQPLGFFEQYSAGELMARLDNNVKLDHSIIQALVPRMIDAAMTIFYLGLLFSYNAVIAAACVAVEVANTLITLAFQEKSAIAARSTATSSSSLDASVLNGMNMIDTIKSGGAERAFYDLWLDSQTQYQGNRLAGYWITNQTSFVNRAHNDLLQLVQLFIGAYFIAHGRFTIGAMVLFQNILNKMRSSMSNCLNTVNTLQGMRTNIERVNDIEDRETRPEIPLLTGAHEKVSKLSGDLSVRHVSYRYNPGDDPAVNDVSLEVKQGQIVAIVGSSGCGKSTLLKLLADLYEPEFGEILYSGKKRNEIPDVVFHSSCVSVDQETVVFEDTAYSNIRMWDSTIEDYEVIMAARDAQIHNRIIRDADGYATRMLENGRNFSGGELQRLELARALAHEPTLLFLDEFTSALDAFTEDRVLKSIRDKGTTCVIVAHRLSTIVDCDRIYVMDKGRIVEEGTHDELYQLNGLYRKLVGSE